MSPNVLQWNKALKREVAEKLGESISIEVGRTLFVSKCQYHKAEQTHYIAVIFFEYQFVSGDIKLSDEHGNYEWLTPEEIINHRLKFVSEDERDQLLTLFTQTN